MIKPYLRFNGNCEEAFKFYAEVFGGEVEHISYYDNQPGLENYTIGKVMHASVRLTDNGGLDGSDSNEDEYDVNYSPEVIVHFKSRNDVENVYNKLSIDARSAEPFTPHPPPDDNGGGAYIIDKFGITWMLCA